MVKAIAFDCFGVLTDDPWEQFVSSFEPGVQVQRARDVHRLYDAGKITKQSAASEIRQLLGRAFVELEDLPYIKVAKNVDLLHYISQLKHDFTIVLLSNIGNDWITKTFLTSDEQQLFEQIILSYRVGLVKPDKRIFQLALTSLNVLPEELIFVDDKEHNCNAAKKLGIQAICYKNLYNLRIDVERIINNG